MRTETKNENIVTKNLNLVTYDYIGSSAIPINSDQLKNVVCYKFGWSTSEGPIENYVSDTCLTRDGHY
jgi:hypothetical protein